MRPHRLQVTAFGAFGGSVELSFDALADSGLFLLHGETGAGKTTLLDAIGFALYGRVPGERGKTRRLRSDHAPADLRTEVVFETTIGSRHLRITRNPQQTRPKRHGDGMTSEPARILLEEENGGAWHAVSTRANEADREIADALGMSAEQFYQVVLLPQGQFARFLHADADERRALLQRLFRTDRFRTVEDWLATRRRTTQQQVAAAEQDLSVLTARIDQAAGPTLTEANPTGTPPDTNTPPATDDPPATNTSQAPNATPVTQTSTATPVAPATPEPSATWAHDLAAAAASRADIAAAAETAARAALDAARAAADRTRALADRQRRRADLMTRRERLAAAAPERDALRTELAAAERAADLAHVFLHEKKFQDVLVTCRKEEERARLAAAPAGLPATAGVADYQAAEVDRRQHTGQLQALQEVSQAAVTEDAVAAQATGRAAARAQDLGSTQRLLAAQRAELTQLSGQRDSAQRATAELPVAQSEAMRLRSAAADAAQLADDCAGVRDLREQKATAREYASDLREYALRLRGERIDGMIGELAARLTDEAPCPVCGSFDHPDPSELQGRRITHAEEEQAFAEAEAAQDAVAKLNSELAIVAARMGEMTARLITADVSEPVLREDAALVNAMIAAADGDASPGGAWPGDAAPGGTTAFPAQPTPAQPTPAQPALFDAPLSRFGGMPAVGTVDRLCALAADLTVAAAAREDAAGELAAEAGQLARLDEELTALRNAITEAERRAATLAAERDSARTAADEARARADAHRATLTSQLGGAPDLDTALAAAIGLADALAAAAQAAQSTVVAEANWAAATTDAEQAAIEAGFADAAAAQTASRSPDWRRDAEEALRAAGTDAAAIDTQLADPDLDVPLDPPADLATTQDAVQQAAADHDGTVRQHQGASARAAELTRLAPQFAGQMTALQPLRARAAEARQLADLAAGLGANELRMTLSAFVLAARLEEVAEAASHRLEKMTAGRYRLAHTDSRRGAGKSGLGLVAQDAWTGQDRDTSTLSGGETFLASLALALGLADVVTAEAAGVTIEALFVDEGFGTLDEETLEEVMTVLDTLREGGRLVGIVSHVAELRQRVPAQVHVRKGRTGSTVDLIAP
jgi:exonuclease SbcC